ncbi:MAG TPA: alpha-glucosidase, partial [Flexilinea sp.]|nr:alpha-glucosidase [Flexilinea sp.]
MFYQIYPRSFKDSNGDGIGDLNGIAEKLDYLKWLGVGAVWLNPVYDSPNDDMGYDIRNYEKIMDEFGTMADFDRLLSEMHRRGIRLIMDLVVNHTSDEHAWFVESRKSRNNPYRDYYIWRPGRNGKEPNNWASFFTPSAWKYDAATDEWYLHLFSEKQPDLNWENQKVRNEVFAMMNRWFDKGIDGFRMDVINLIAKKPGLPDSDKKPNAQGYVMADDCFANQPKVHDYLKEMRKTCFDGRDCMCVGETPFVTKQIAMDYVDPKNHELDMLFQFDLMDIDSGESGKWEVVPWKIADFKAIITGWQEALKDGWNSLYWSNHDQPRPVSRFGSCTSEIYRVRSAKMLAALMYLLKGTPFIYQGEEIGMTNMPFSDISELRDIESINFYKLSEKSGNSKCAWESILIKGRDNSRTPMQWDSSENGGFTTGKPWIRINPNYRNINVRNAMEDDQSILHFYR